MNRAVVAQIHQTIVMHVPEHLVGSLIGRHGSTIQSIRMNSGSQISIESRQPSSTDEAAGQRKVTIIGAARSNEIAASSISNIISYAQHNSQSRGAGPQSSGPVLPVQSLQNQGVLQNGGHLPHPLPHGQPASLPDGYQQQQSQFATGLPLSTPANLGVSTSYRPRGNTSL
eukprot:gb/GEZN01017695.1/.p1 GENE.gb/GEZN01017695.1/~~gb/GEZN01017695.1/.p1  ORF type:complete len:187 (-),score=24.84 gb/GEZN01017695.1/:227-739(-)